MKAVRSVIASNTVPYLQIMSVGSYSTKKREERKKGEDWVGESRSESSVSISLKMSHVHLCMRNRPHTIIMHVGGCIPDV